MPQQRSDAGTKRHLYNGPCRPLLEDYASWLPKSVPIHPMCGRPTLSVGRIYGGQSVNIVPDSCTIEIDRRLVPGEDPLVAWSTVREQLIERFGPHIVTDEAWISSPALSNTDNAWLAEPLLSCIYNGCGSSSQPGRRLLHPRFDNQLCGRPRSRFRPRIHRASAYRRRIHRDPATGPSRRNLLSIRQCRAALSPTAPIE